MKFKIIDEFSQKSKSFKITAVIAAVVVVVLGIILYLITPNIPAKSISFPKSTIYMEENMTLTLNPECTPYNVSKKNLVYECSDTTIAKFNKNELIPLRNGTVEVYCYDKKSKVKSNAVTVKIISNISSLIDGEKEADSSGSKNNVYNEKFVYYTKNGKKYHKYSCYYKGKTPIKDTVENALKTGRTACSICKP